MNKPLLFSIGLTGLLCLSLTSAAQASDHCRAQARELAVRADGKVFPNMTAGQRAELRKLAEETCERFASKTAADSDGESSGDWFTDRVMNGEPADKPGNRRLERMGR
ncbi:ClpP class serine protease [Methylohalomonas lacus]|uniref:ClpP class serine protease n=1 Tax=Methylohalomonas lacus TaxID=398773 RepID=A0AAE3HKF0_9GAMM|nr:hypothetical protein [Methylohalomonas lacus]MCS3902853.1 ClpP class serine protease [Methylohalomonas lacus]